MNRLRGKHALITGGTSGIVLATAREFIAEGARVVITGNNPAKLEETAQGILGLVKARRFGDASEITKAVVYPASDETRFAVGSELIVDGGLSL